MTHDLLGLFERFTPRFVKRYAELHAEMHRAFEHYIEDVHTQAFPAEEHTVEMSEQEWSEFLREAGDGHLD